MPQVPFVGGAYTGRVREIGWNECLNLYVENTEIGEGKYASSLIGTPGTIDIPSWTFPNDENGKMRVIRGIYTTSRDSWLLVVAGNKLYQMPDSESNSPIELATLSDLQTKVSIVDDGRYLSIADGFELWVLDLNNKFTPLTTPLSGMVKPNSVEFIGGYTVCNNTYNDPAQLFPPTSNQMYFSNLYNASKWNASFAGVPENLADLRFISAEGNADPILKIQRVGDSIWLFGSRSYEIHMLSENQDRPFSRVGGSLTDIGIYAADSCARIGDTGYFMGVTSHGGTVVYKTQGYDVVRISNHAIEYEILQNADPTTAIGWTYEQEGHKFYVLSFKGSDLTICYDDTTGLWHNRSSRKLLTDEQTCWEPIYASSRAGTTYVGSILYSRIFRIDLSKCNEWDGRPIKRIRSSPIIWSDLHKVRHNSFQVDMHTGAGLYNGASSETDPQCMMQFSDNNGASWSSEYWCPIGKTGEYKTRVRYNRLGMAYNRIYRITITANITVEIVGANVVTDTAPRQ